MRTIIILFCKKMPIDGDLHIHLDDWQRRDGTREGMTPEQFLEAVAGSGNQLVVCVQHWQMTAEVNRLLRLIRKKCSIVPNVRYGIEFTLFHDGLRFHAGHIFDYSFDIPVDVDCLNNGSDPPELKSGVFQKFQEKYPGITILNHPSHVKNHRRHLLKPEEVVCRMVEVARIGKFKAIEILNAMIASKNGSNKITDSFGFKRILAACEIFRRLIQEMPGLLPVASSDAHKPTFEYRKSRTDQTQMIKTVGTVSTRSAGSRPEDLLKALNGGKTKAICKDRYAVGPVVEAVLETMHGEMDEFLKVEYQ